MHSRVPLCAVLGLVLPATLNAQDLKVGDPAPALSIAKWVKGDAVGSFEKDKVYVVEFWATWCGPCIASMPHLSGIQKDYARAGLKVIGVTSVDRENSLRSVQQMVAKEGRSIGYAIAWDRGNETNDAYLKAARRASIPCSFLVDKAGKIAYIGHPMWLDLAIEGVLDGTWDARKGAAKIRAAERRMDEVYASSENELATHRKTVAFLRDYPSLNRMFGDMRVSLLLEARQYAMASAVGARMVDGAIADKDPRMLNHIAWSIVDPDADVGRRDLDLAMRAAVKAVAFTKGRSAAILDTLARVHAWKEDFEKAIYWQTRAVKIDGSLRSTLEEYQRRLARPKPAKR